jgi:hypothetical protein
MIKDFIYESENCSEYEPELTFAKKYIRTGKWSTDWLGRRVPEKEEQIDTDYIIDDHFRKVPSFCCRQCGRTIIKYSDIYQGREYYAGFITKYIFSQKNGYCRICALKQAKKYEKSYAFPDYVKYPNEYAGETMYFLDKDGFPTGEKIEEDLTLGNITVVRERD